MGTNFNRVKKIMTVLLAFIVGLSVVTLLPSVYAENEPVKVETSFEVVEGTYDVTLDVSAAEGYTVKEVTFNSETKTEAPYTYTVNEAGTYDYDVAYVNNEDAENVLHYTNSMEITTETPTPSTEVSSSPEASEAPNEDALTWTLPSEAELQWSVVEENTEYDYVDVLGVKATDKEGNDVAVTLKDNGGIDLTVASIYTLVFAAVNPVTDEEETQEVLLTVYGDEIAMADQTQITVKWNAATVALGTGTSADLTIKPGNNGVIGLSATASFSLAEQYNANAFTFNLPKSLSGLGTTGVADLDLSSFALPVCPASTEGWCYVDNGTTITVKNVETTEPGGKTFNLPLKYNLDPNKATDEASQTLAATGYPAGVLSTGTKITVDTYSNMTGAHKDSALSIYAYPDNTTSYYGLPESAFDFTNYYYVEYRVWASIAGSKGGTLTVDESTAGNFDAGDGVVAACSNSYACSPDAGGSRSGNVYTFNNTDGGNHIVYYLIRYSKATHPLVGQSVDLPKNVATVKFTPTGEATQTLLPEYGPMHYQTLSGHFGNGEDWAKGPRDMNGGSMASGALYNIDSQDVYIGTFSIGGKVFELADGLGTGFTVADDYLFGQEQNAPATTPKKLEAEAYAFKKLNISVTDYSWNGTKKSPIAATDANNATVDIYYQLAPGGSYTFAETVPYSSLAATNGYDWDCTIYGGGIAGFKVVGKNFHYEADISVKPDLYIRKGKLDKLINGTYSSSNPSVFIQNNSYVIPMDVTGTNAVRFEKYNTVDLSAMTADEYKTFQEGTYPSGDPINSKDQLLALDGANTQFRQTGWFLATGLKGESGVWQQNETPTSVYTDGVAGTVNYTISAYQRYPMSVDNTDIFMHNGGSLAREEGVIYDLLPLGVEFDDSMTPTATGVGGTEAQVTATPFNNYNNTGRTLVKFEISNVTKTGGAALPEGNTYYPRVAGSTVNDPETSAMPYIGNYLQTGFTVTFKTKVMSSNSFAAALSTNLVIYQEPTDTALVGDYTNNGSGICESLPDKASEIGSRDVASLTGDVYKEYVTGFGTKLDNLSGANHTHNSTVYNIGKKYPQFQPFVVTGVVKETKENSETEYAGSTTVAPNGSYSYRITYGNDHEGNVTNIVIYDVLEKGYDGLGTTPESWRGYFDEVDTSTIDALGIDWTVYYSTSTTLTQTDTSTGFDVPGAGWSVFSSRNAGQVFTGDKKTITAIAIDCKTMVGGGLFSLGQNQQIQATIKYNAPTSYDRPDTDLGNTTVGKVKGYAYNTSFVKADVIEAGQTTNFVATVDPQYATKVQLVDARIAIDLTKNDSITTGNPVVPGAYFSVKGKTNTHLLTAQINVDITVKSAEDGDQYVDDDPASATFGTLINCTAGKLYEVVTTDDNGTPDDRTDDTELLYSFKLYPGDTNSYEMEEIVVPHNYVKPTTVKDDKYTITVTETNTPTGTPPEDNWTYDYDVTYTYIDPDTQVETDKSTIDDDNSMLFNLLGRTISGIVWVDNNQNGEPEPTDPTYPERLWDGMTVSLIDEATNTQAIDVTGAPVADVTTDANGYYKFDKLPLGSYRVVINVNADNYDATVINSTCVDTAGKPNGNMSYNSRTRTPGEYVVIGELDVNTKDILNANAGLIPVVTIVKNVNNKLAPLTNPVVVSRDEVFTFQIKVNNHAEDPMDVIPNYTVVDDVNSRIIIDSAPDAAINGQNVKWTNQVLKMGENLYTINAHIHGAGKDEVFDNMAYGEQADNPHRVESNYVYLKFRIDTNLVTYLDCEGNTVKIEWVDYKGSSSAPGGGFIYSGGVNVTADQVLYPENCEFINKYRVPNTATK